MIQKSRYSPPVYIITLIYTIFIGVLVYVYFITDPFRNSEKIPVPNIVLLFSILILILFFLYKHLKAAIRIVVSDKTITIHSFINKQREISNPEIVLINLFETGDIFGWSTIVTKIELTDGTKIIIRDLYYRNIGEIKQAITESFKEKIKSFLNEKKLAGDTANNEGEVKKFAGNPIINFNTIMFGGLIIYILISTFTKSIRSFDEKWPVFLILTPLIFLALVIQMNYFTITKGSLIVKNHFIPWYSKTYELDNIISMNFEYPGQRSKSLRITTKDFKSRYYTAGSLREKHWKALREKIDESGIYFIP